MFYKFFPACCLCFFLSVTLYSQEEYGLKPFNYPIIKTLNDSGALDMNQHRTGYWVCYQVDSGYARDQAKMMDKGNNLYPPARILLFKMTGSYDQYGKTGEWKIYKSYSSYPPIQWDLQEIKNYQYGKTTHRSSYYYSTGKTMHEEVPVKDSAEVYTVNYYYSSGKLMRQYFIRNGQQEGHEKHYNYLGILVADYLDRHGVQHGITRIYYSNGKLLMEVLYKDGLPWEMISAFGRDGKPVNKGTLKNGTGTMPELSELGTVVQMTELRDGYNDGTVTTYYLNGKISSVATYSKGRLVGVQKMYNKDGSLLCEFQPAEDDKYDLQKNYYPNGQLICEMELSRDKIWNIKALYDTAGKPLDFGSYKNGTGELRSYDDSCRLVSVAHYNEGKQDGLSKTFYPNGKLHIEEYFNRGLRDGLRKQYAPDGTLLLQQNYSHGMLNGVSEFYRKGKALYSLYFVDDRLWNVISMTDDKGMPMDYGNIKDGCGHFKMYDDSLRLVSDCEYKFGLQHGTTIVYYPEGKKRAEYNFVMDNMEGKQRSFRKSGALLAVYMTHEGDYDGTMTIYHDNGKVWTRRIYVNGLLWNVEMNNDANGNPMNKGTIKNGTGTMLRYDEKGKLIYTYEFLNGQGTNHMGDENEDF